MWNLKSKTYIAHDYDDLKNIYSSQINMANVIINDNLDLILKMSEWVMLSIHEMKVC